MAAGFRRASRLCQQAATRPRIAGNCASCGGCFPMIHRLWTTVFPCGSNCRTAVAERWPNRRPWVIPVVRARTAPDFSTRFSHWRLILASTSPIRRAHARRRRASSSTSRAPAGRRGCGQGSASRRRRQRWRWRLAEAKALVGRRAAGDWVIGSDSVVDGRRRALFASRATAPRRPRTCASFSGRTMLLSSAVALARDGAGRLEPCRNRAARTSAPLSTSFIESYLDAEWPEVGYCVGVFRMEGRGVTLFDQVEGSHFTILGMPLLPLLGALARARADGVMTSTRLMPKSSATRSSTACRRRSTASGSRRWASTPTIAAAGSTRAELPAYRRARARRSAIGAGRNVTMPLKLDAVDLADEATDRAVAAGAANLLLLRDGKLFAANTDVGAIATLLDRDCARPGAALGSVTLLGNGGAARAALVALKLLGIDAGPDPGARHGRGDEAGGRVRARRWRRAPFDRADRQRRPDQRHAARHGRPDCLNCDLAPMPADGLGVRHGHRPGRDAADRRGAGARAGGRRRARHAGRAGRDQLQAVVRRRTRRATATPSCWQRLRP